MLARISALRLESLIDGDELEATLLAAVFAEALRTDRSPRGVLDALWSSLPACDAWRGGVGEAVAELVDGLAGPD